MVTPYLLLESHQRRLRAHMSERQREDVKVDHRQSIGVSVSPRDRLRLQVAGWSSALEPFQVSSGS